MENLSVTPYAAFQPLFAGRIAAAIAVTAVVGLVTLALLYAGMPPFGPINDLTNAFGGLLAALLVWQFHPLLRQRAPGLALLLLLLAWAAAAAIMANSLLVAFGRMHWMTGGMVTAVGYGLLGVWLLGLLFLAGPQPFLPAGLARLGTIAGIAMLFGLLAGPLLASRASLNANPLVWVAYVGAGAGFLLFPLWCWLVGRRLVLL